MRRILFTIFAVVFISLSFILGTLLVPVLRLFGIPKKRAFFLISRIWAKSVLFFSGVKLNVAGIENIFFDGPKIFISNHQGNFDIPILLFAIPSHFRFLIKKELYSAPFLGWHLRGRGDIPIDRQKGHKARETLRKLSGLVESGDPVLIFPEGTRSPDGNIQSFKRGSLVLATSSGAKIVPIAISGSYNIQQKGSILINPTEVFVNIGKPISISKEQSSSADQHNLVEDIQKEVISLLHK